MPPGGAAKSRACAHADRAEAAATPDAVAVICEGQSPTMPNSTDRQSLGHRLIAPGVTPDKRVAICLERRFELIRLAGDPQGRRGVRAAGSELSGERLAYMLEDSAPMALLTQAALCDRCRRPPCRHSCSMTRRPQPRWRNIPAPTPIPVRSV